MCVCGQARRPAVASLAAVPGGVWLGEVGDRVTARGESDRGRDSRGWQVRWVWFIKFESTRAVPFKVGERAEATAPLPAVVGD